ncbi:MAG: NAD(+) synthase [Patescibacteria group bacterium]
MKTLLLINPKQETKKIVKFLKSVQKKTKLDKVVIGLSGGIDSVTTLYLLKKAYSKKNIFVVYLPYDIFIFPFLDGQLRQIKDVIKKTKIPENNFFVVPFKKPANNIINQMKTLGKKGLDKIICEIKECFTCPNTDYLNKIRVGNMMARLRMITLFDVAKKINGLVCGTENRSEKLLGYFTRFGDAASDIEPISHLYKTQIYQLAKYLRVPKEIINQPPSAGLWDGQTDEGEFGFTYKEADQVLYLMDDRRIDIKKVKKMGFPNAEKIIKRFQDNQFKLKTPYKLD